MSDEVIKIPNNWYKADIKNTFDKPIQKKDGFYILYKDFNLYFFDRKDVKKIATFTDYVLAEWFILDKALQTIIIENANIKPIFMLKEDVVIGIKSPTLPLKIFVRSNGNDSIQLIHDSTYFNQVLESLGSKYKVRPIVINDGVGVIL